MASAILMGEGRDYQRILGREVVSTFCSVRSEVRIATEKVPEKEIKGIELVLRGVSGGVSGGFRGSYRVGLMPKGYQR